MYYSGLQAFENVVMVTTYGYISRWKLLFIILFPLLMSGCNIFESEDTVTRFEYDFTEAKHGWEPFFTNYYAGRENKMELTSGYRSLPEPLDTTEKALFISGTNTSDDLKMLFRKQVEGLEPHTTYRVRTTVRFATEEPSGCAGIGGAPGEAVKVISAAGSRKPEAFTDDDSDDDYYLLNIQHRNDAQEWYQNRIMGNIANSRECEEGDQFEIKELNSSTTQEVVRTNKEGKAWLLFGTRSGFEGETELYYTYFEAEFRK